MEVENLVVITGVDFTMVLTGLLSDLEKYPLRIITFIDDNLDPGAGQAKFRYGPPSPCAGRAGCTDRQRHWPRAASSMQPLASARSM
jgi:hypothetical protein